MSLLQGNLSIRRFLALGPVPTEEDLVEGLTQDRFTPFEDGLEEERVGWADWRNLQITPPDPDWILQERFAILSLRIDIRRVPTSLLKAKVELALQNLAQNEGLAFVGKQARISITDEIKAELTAKVLPTPKTFDVAWDLKAGIVWTTASSTAAQGLLIGLFIKSFGVELQPLAPLLVAGRLVPEVSIESLMALDPLDLTLEEASNE
jgi:DNA recombination-dependent growth factor C